MAFQGELGAYSEMAARAYFCEAVEVIAQVDFAALFAAVEDGTCTHGMVPIENALMGSIHENYDHLLNRQVQIIGEIKLRIMHNLIVNSGVRLEAIRHIYSQAPALAQCTEFITSLSSAKAVVAPDTAGAVKSLKESGARDAAAIASAQAAVDYGLEILQAGIEDNHQNHTRFLVVAKEAIPVEEPAKTSIVFDLRDVPGALYKCLGVFAQRHINLLKIESRPLPGQPWKYAFYLDFEGHCDLGEGRQALKEIRQYATFVKNLGTYRIGETVEGRIVEKRHLPIG